MTDDDWDDYGAMLDLAGTVHGFAEISLACRDRYIEAGVDSRLTDTLAAVLLIEMVKHLGGDE
jgi:hypothetical protein